MNDMQWNQGPMTSMKRNKGMSRMTMRRRSNRMNRVVMTRRRDEVSKMMMRGYIVNSTGWNKTATRKRSRESNM